MMHKLKRSKDRTYCCVPQCNSRACKEPELSFHCFPALRGSEQSYCALKRRKQWISVLRIGKEVSDKMKVCSKHFQKTDYFFPTVPSKRPHLKKNAIPSLNLPLSSTDNVEITVKKRKKIDEKYKSQCVVCAKRQSKKPCRRLFSFPKDPVLCKMWVTECNKPFLKNKTIEQLNTSYKVCSDHFMENDYMPGRKHHLKSKACPKISSRDDKTSKEVKNDLSRQEINKKLGVSTSSKSSIITGQKKISDGDLPVIAQIYLSPKYKEWYLKAKTHDIVNNQLNGQPASKLSKQSCNDEPLFVNECVLDGPKITSITSLVTQESTESHNSHENIGETGSETESCNSYAVIGETDTEEAILKQEISVNTRTLSEQVRGREKSESRLSKLRHDNQVSFHKQFMPDATQLATVVEKKNVLVEQSYEAVNEDERKFDCGQKTLGSEIKYFRDEHSQFGEQKSPVENRKTLKKSSPLNFENYIGQEKNNLHPLDTFFLLMASTVKKFNLVDQHFVKTQLFSLVSGIEERYIQQNEKSS